MASTWRKLERRQLYLGLLSGSLFFQSPRTRLVKHWAQLTKKRLLPVRDQKSRFAFHFERNPDLQVSFQVCITRSAVTSMQKISLMEGMSRKYLFLQYRCREILLEELEEALKEERLERGIVLFTSHSTWSKGRDTGTFIKKLPRCSTLRLLITYSDSPHIS